MFELFTATSARMAMVRILQVTNPDMFDRVMSNISNWAHAHNIDAMSVTDFMLRIIDDASIAIDLIMQAITTIL